MIHTGDCLEVMATMPADSVDAVVTDPPYGLEFMGKEWDSFQTAQWRGEREAWQDNHPENHIAHRLARGPRYQAGNAFQAWCEQWGREALRVTKPGGYLLAFGGTRTHHRLVCGLEDAGWIIRDELDWIYASGFPKGKANLKPAHEPIVLARKPGPLRPLGIDESRIAAEPYSYPNGPKGNVDPTSIALPRIETPVESHPLGRWPSNVLLSDPELFDEPNPYVVGSGATDAGGGYGVRGDGPLDGRTSFALPGQGQVVGYGDSGGYSRFFIVPKSARADREPVLRGQVEATKGGSLSGAETRPDRPTNHPIRENAHPTVKPTDLMRHLVRLVTPQGGTVLDPFLGSGSTALACELEGFPWIGIEKEPEYVKIAEARLNGTQRGLGLDVPAPTKAPPKTHPDLSKHQPKRRAPANNWTGGWIGTEEEPVA